MAERGDFTFQPWGQENTKRRGRGRGRGQCWAGSRGGYRYRPKHNPNKVGQPPQRPRTFDCMNLEGRITNHQEGIHLLPKLELGIGSKPCIKEEVLSPGSSSSSKRSCTEMEENEENESKVHIKKRCKKNLAGTFPCSQEDNDISMVNLNGNKVRSEVKITAVDREDWDEEIRIAKLNSKQNTLCEAVDMVKEKDDGEKTTAGKIDGLMLLQGSYTSSSSTGTQQSMNLDWEVGLPSDGEVKLTSPRKFVRDKVVDCLSSAVTENCTCTSDEDSFKIKEGKQDHALCNPKGGRSFSSPTAGSLKGPLIPNKSKSDSWTGSVFSQGSAKKKGKLKKKQRAATIPEYQGSTDDDTDENMQGTLLKGERSKSCRQKKGYNSASKSLKDAERKFGFATAEVEKSDETQVKQKTKDKLSAEDDDGCQADDSLSDDENWKKVVKKLSADGVDAEEIQDRRPLPPDLPTDKSHTDESTSMDAPLSFRQDYRARFTYPPPAYMPYNHAYPSMRPPIPYCPPMWPMMQDPYFYGPAMMRGFHPDAIARYPIIHRFPQCVQQAAETVSPTHIAQSPGSECQDRFYTVNESGPEREGYLHNMNQTCGMNAFDGTDYTFQENTVEEDETYSENVFDSSGSQIYISQELNCETSKREPNVSFDENVPFLQTTLPDICEHHKSFDNQSDFISTEDEDYFYPRVCEPPSPKCTDSSVSVQIERGSRDQPNYNWYQTPPTGVGPTRTKSKVWGLNFKQMKYDSSGQKKEETSFSIPSNSNDSSQQPPSYAAAVCAGRQEPPGGQNRVTYISSAHLEERRRKSYSGVIAPHSGWASGHPLVKFVSPQNNKGPAKEKPQESPFWQSTPRPEAFNADTSSKFKSWSAGSQGWGSYNITRVPRPVSAPPKPKMFAEILQRPRRLTLEDEVRGETIPTINSWRSSTEIEDSAEIQYPTSDIDYLDTHAHIDLLFQRHMFKGTFAKFCLVNNFPTNFAGCVAIFCYPVNFSNSYSLADNLLKESNIWGSFGCHPHQVKHYDGIMEQKIKDWMNHPKTVALGEIGLDYSDRPAEITSDHELQKVIFQRQLQIALETKKPLVIHCRDAEEDTLSIMSKMVPRNHKIHRHCFTGPPQDAIKFLRAFPNSFIGLTALVTFPTATNTHQTARAIPLNRLLLETDTPYFLPRKVRCQKWSHPGMALLVAERISQLRGTTLDDVLSNVRANTMTMYGI
ncbi:uncharacterized protein LOC129256909 [Lytechinus pictus]|uniref:uncharacterized protein LOC129256909 n=1 Tax=Lytechinus pictus TaxID=7653 RepID=UPI0030B9F5E1